MKMDKRKVLRFIYPLLLICAFLSLRSIPFRQLWCLWLLVSFGLYLVQFKRPKALPWMMLTWLASIITVFLPFDAVTEDFPGPPHWEFVRGGDGTYRTMGEARRGEGPMGIGDYITPALQFAPTRVWVW